MHVPPEVQLERVIQRDGLSPQAAQARIDAQLPIDDKARRADWIIDNSGDLAFTRAQVEWLVARLRADAARG